MISTSEIKISCIIDIKHTETAVKILHKAFDLEKPGRSKKPKRKTR